MHQSIKFSEAGASSLSRLQLRLLYALFFGAQRGNSHQLRWVKATPYTITLDKQAFELTLSHTVIKHQTADGTDFRAEVLGSKIGKGTFSCVYTCLFTLKPLHDLQIMQIKEKSPYRQRVVKVVNKQQLPVAPEELPLSRLQLEARIAQSVDYLHAKPLSQSASKQRFFFVQRRLPGWELFKLQLQDIADGRLFTLSQRLCLSVNLLKAVAECHARGIVHCDIKGENILVDEVLNCRLIDFGLAFLQREPSSISCGSLHYAAPEVLLGSQTTTKADVFSTYRVLEIIWHGRGEVFGISSPHRMLKFNQQRPYNRRLFNHLSPAPSRSLQASVKALLSAMSEPLPEKRISIEEALTRMQAIEQTHAHQTACCKIL